MGGVCIRRVRGTTSPFTPHDLGSGSADRAEEVQSGDAGTFDFRGPFVLGRRGERHPGLRWGTLDEDGVFSVFRAAKFRLFELEPALVRRAIETGHLVAEVDLTDEQGYPRCATVRPPLATGRPDPDARPGQAPT
jgi:Family of unknown function (DUF5990)